MIKVLLQNIKGCHERTIEEPCRLDSYTASLAHLMKTDLPPFKHGEYNSESAYTLNRAITPLAALRLLYELTGYNLASAYNFELHNS